jgi:hypothetical protein
LKLTFKKHIIRLFIWEGDMNPHPVSATSKSFLFYMYAFTFETSLYDSFVETHIHLKVSILNQFSYNMFLRSAWTRTSEHVEEIY